MCYIRTEDILSGECNTRTGDLCSFCERISLQPVGTEDFLVGLQPPLISVVSEELGSSLVRGGIKALCRFSRAER